MNETRALECDQISAGYAQLAFAVVGVSIGAADWCARRADTWAFTAEFNRSPWMGQAIAIAINAMGWMFIGKGK